MRLIATNGKTFSSVILCKDGSWLEIVNKFCYLSNKQHFATKEDWLINRETNYTKLVEGKKIRKPIDPSLTGIDYLLEVQHRYSIRKQSPAYESSLMKKLSIYETTYARYQELLTIEENAEKISLYKERCSVMQECIRKLEPLISADPEGSKLDVYSPLNKSTIFAYILEGDTFVPLGFCVIRKILVYKKKYGTTFAEVGLPAMPNLWIVKGAKIFRPI